MRPERSAEIHDLGYARYDGARTPPGSRYRVIAQNLVGVAWRGRWLTKLAVIAAVGTTIAGGVAMYLLRTSLARMVMLRGAPLPQAEQIIFITLGFYEASAFFIGAVWGCAAVSDDLRLGAFQFYFARALRVRTYVAGKLLGLAALAGLPMLAGPLILGLLRLLYADGLDDAVQASPIVLRAAALGLIGTAAYVLPVAGLGALAGRRQLAQALYAVYWLLICPALWSMSWPLHLPALRLFSVPANLTCIGRELFGVAHDRSDPPTWAAALALSVLCAAGLWLVWRSVDRAAHRGLGGGA